MPFIPRLLVRVAQENYLEVMKMTIGMIAEAVQGEKEDELFYDYLLSVAPTEKEKNIITSIRDDEVRHNHYFKQMYGELTGEAVESMDGVEFMEPESYLDGLKSALFGELRAVEKYREIRRSLPSKYYRDVLFNIITDELRHANMYNYLITLNS